MLSIQSVVVHRCIPLLNLNSGLFGLVSDDHQTKHVSKQVITGIDVRGSNVLNSCAKRECDLRKRSL